MGLFDIFKSSPSESISKAASENVTRTPPMTTIGTEALQFMDDLAEVTMPHDLNFPNRLRTFDLMKQNPTIYTCLYLDRMYTSKAFKNPKFTFTSNPQSKAAAEFLEYMFNTMEKPLSYYVREAVNGYRSDGFAVQLKVYKKYKKGEYEGKRGLRKLGWRDARTLDPMYPFVYTNGGRDIVSVRQSNQAFINTMVSSNDYYDQPVTNDGYTDIPYWRCIVYGEDVSSSNPLGQSPLVACYKDWKKLHLINQLETSGVTKDMAGLLEIKIPEDVLQRASEDPAGKDAAFVRRYMRDASAIHAGKQSFVMTPSNTFDNATSVNKYAINLKGIDGGLLKSYPITEM